MDLEELRKKIDGLDFEILKLLKERTETALKTKRFKTELKDGDREKQVLKNVRKYAESLGLLSPGFVQKIYKDIILESRILQKKGYSLIGFQGEHGAYGEVAARVYDPDLAFIPCLEFTDVFEEVEQGNLDLGIVPVENSLGGPITQVNELFIHKNLKVIAEVEIPIHHCLLTLPGTDHKDLRTVYSHPQALTQCRDFIHRTKLEGVPFYDTAGAARMVRTDMPQAAAAIASKLCAELYNLQIVKENIEDYESNKTRFLVVSRNRRDQPGDKSSIIFSVKERAGALFDVLKQFAQADINLTRIESMPNRDHPGNYYFFLDYEGKNKDPELEEILAYIEGNTIFYKFLGSYNKEV